MLTEGEFDALAIEHRLRPYTLGTLKTARETTLKDMSTGTSRAWHRRASRPISPL
jgi:hypothetical protein